MTEPDVVVPQPAPKPRRNWGVLVAGIVIGMVVGAGIVGLTWTFTGGDPAAGPEGDVVTACSLVRRTGQMSRDSKTDFEQTARWGAAGALMYSVAENHPQYKPLADALQRSTMIFASTYRAEGPEFEAEVRKAREFCEGR